MPAQGHVQQAYAQPQPLRHVQVQGGMQMGMQGSMQGQGAPMQAGVQMIQMAPMAQPQQYQLAHQQGAMYAPVVGVVAMSSAPMGSTSMAMGGSATMQPALTRLVRGDPIPAPVRVRVRVRVCVMQGKPSPPHRRTFLDCAATCTAVPLRPTHLPCRAHTTHGSVCVGGWRLRDYMCRTPR